MYDVLSKGKACSLERVKGSVQNGQIQTFDNRLWDVVCTLGKMCNGINLLFTGGSVQLITIASISFERYQALYKPFEKHNVLIRIRISIISSWIVGIMCMILDWTLFQESPTHLLCNASGPECIVRNLSYELGIYIFVPLTFLSVCVILVFYGSILYLVQKHVKSTQHTLGGFKKKTSRIAPAKDKDVLVNNFMPSDFTIVENDAQPSLMENSNNSKNKKQSLSAMNSSLEESFTSKDHLTVPSNNRSRKVSTKIKSSAVNSISKDISFLPPVQTISKAKSTRNSPSAKSPGKNNFECHDQILAATHLHTESNVTKKLKTETTLKMANKKKYNKRYFSAPELIQNSRDSRMARNKCNKQVKNVASKKPLLSDECLGNDNLSSIKHKHTLVETPAEEKQVARTSLSLIPEVLIKEDYVWHKDTTKLPQSSTQGEKETTVFDSKTYDRSSSMSVVSDKPWNGILTDVGVVANSSRGNNDESNSMCNYKSGIKGKESQNNMGSVDDLDLNTAKRIATPNVITTDVSEMSPKSSQTHLHLATHLKSTTDKATKLPPKKDPKKKSKSKKDSTSSVVQIYDADGMTMKAKTTRTNVTGDICVMNNSNKIKGKRKIEAKSAKRTAIVLVTFLIAWLPFPLMIIVLWIFNAQKATQVEALLSAYLISLTLSLLAASINPLVYGATNKQFYKEFKRIIKKCRQDRKRK